MAYYAISHQDFDQTRKGDEIILFITYNAYLTALRKMPNHQRIPCLKEHSKGKNCLITLERTGDTSLIVHEQTPIEPTPEQIKESEKQYELLIQESESRRQPQ